LKKKIAGNIVSKLEREALRTWRNKLGDAATARSLIRILCKQKLVDKAEIVASKCQKPPECISVFEKNFRDFYINKFSHPSKGQWPCLLKLFDLPPMYVDLKLHEVPMEESSAMQEIQLSDAFKNSSSRLMILFQGIAGSGKTTLSWHACREWANKKLLQQFQILIHVQISKLQKQNVSTLADLIPDPNEDARNELSQAIIDIKGEGVCFLLEGIDEASNNLWKFIFSVLSNDEYDLPQLSYIITSRPDDRLFKVQQLLTSKIVIDGFTNETLNEFLISAVPSDRFEEAKLIVEKSPQLQTLCTLPLNAVVVSFLVQCYKDEIPITQTELFNLLFCHICIRHMQLRTKGGKPKKVKKLPDDLPSDLKSLFGKLCKLAHTAMQEKKKEFSIDELVDLDFQDEVEDKLGIIQLHQEFTLYGVEEHYSFPHLALQQFLAAIHVSLQADSYQISFIKDIVSQDPLNEVLPFHAGRTTSNKVRNKIVECLDFKQPLNDHTTAMALQQCPTVSNDPRRKALALCKCLYECHNEPLMNKVNLPMESKSGDLGIDFRYIVSFQNMWMSPLECLAVGYFVRYKSINMPERQSLTLNLGNCSISDASVSALTKELKRGVDYRTPGRIVLALPENKLSNTSLLSIKELLKGQSNIEGFGVQKCFLSLDKKIYLKHIIEGLNRNSSCRHAALGYNDLNKSHVYRLILLIQSCKQLYAINLSACSFDGVVPLMGKAFRLSNLKCLQLTSCKIDDKMLVSLAKELSLSPYLTRIELYNNPFTTDGLMVFILRFTHDISILEEVSVDPVPCLAFLAPGLYFEVLKWVNKFRKQHNRSKLLLTSAALSQLQIANSIRYLDSQNEPALSRRKCGSAD
jgi:hypothetical protein